MKPMPKISDAEWVVMKVFWRQSPLTANQVIEALRDTDWNPKTIRTLIGRLERKKALGFEKTGREHAYYPLAGEHECVRQEAHCLLERAGAAALKPMLAAFLRDEALSEKEIEELKQILDGKQDS